MFTLSQTKFILVGLMATAYFAFGATNTAVDNVDSYKAKQERAISALLASK